MANRARLYETDGFLDGVVIARRRARDRADLPALAILIGGGISALTAILLVVAYKRRDGVEILLPIARKWSNLVREVLQFAGRRLHVRKRKSR